MSPRHSTSTNRLPSPHRAPGFLEELATARSDEAGVADGPGGRRCQRTLDGFLAAAIRRPARRRRQW